MDNCALQIWHAAPISAAARADVFKITNTFEIATTNSVTGTPTIVMVGVTKPCRIL